MKVVVSKEQGKVVVEDVPVPEPKDGELLVKMKACGICGSDVEKVFGDYGMGSKKIGHEISGEVAKSNSKDFAVGDRVFVRQRVPCYKCHYCLHGNHTICDLFQKTNVDPCGLAEYFIVPKVNVENGGVVKLPDNLTFEEAAAAEPLSCCIRAINKLDIKQGDSAVIIGSGPVGVMNALALKAAGAEKIFILDINDSRLEIAKKYGTPINSLKQDPEQIIKNSTQIGADVVIIATSVMKVFDQAMKFIRKGGKIMLFGVPPKNSTISPDANYLFANEITILSSGYSIKREIETALNLISTGKIDMKSLITHKFKIDESQKAFDLAHKPENAMKIVITT
ncbi:MAG: alcohol dehydrogenase catalytic domain-containing protein [Candidatus Aenigmarchaeota archaeon]|nr:alcohol dehydrogenase catalytic domain-containing protein [Candidatus Aenigmarchaeota archaeon]